MVVIFKGTKVAFTLSDKVAFGCDPLGCLCSGAPEQWVVDLGIGGLIDTEDCDACDEIGGEYTLTQKPSYTSHECWWTFEDDTYCPPIDYDFWHPLPFKLAIVLRLLISGAQWLFQLNLCLSNDGRLRPLAFYGGDGWCSVLDSYTNGFAWRSGWGTPLFEDCMSVAEGTTGVIQLSEYGDAFNVGCSSVPRPAPCDCDSTMPSIVSIWPA